MVSIRTPEERDTVNADIISYMKKIDTITTLRYYRDDNTLNGDLIIDSYDLNVFN